MGNFGYLAHEPRRELVMAVPECGAQVGKLAVDGARADALALLRGLRSSRYSRSSRVLMEEQVRLPKRSTQEAQLAAGARGGPGAALLLGPARSSSRR